MTKIQIRNSLHKLIDRIDDDHILKAVHTILSKQDNIVGYSIKGEPITDQELKREVKSASERVKSGKFIDHEDLKKQSLNW